MNYHKKTGITDILHGCFASIVSPTNLYIGSNLELKGNIGRFFGLFVGIATSVKMYIENKYNWSSGIGMFFGVFIDTTISVNRQIVNYHKKIGATDMLHDFLAVLSPLSTCTSRSSTGELAIVPGGAIH